MKDLFNGAAASLSSLSYVSTSIVRKLHQSQLNTVKLGSAAQSIALASIRLDAPEPFDFTKPDNWPKWKK